jgi:hypothetical protein
MNLRAEEESRAVLENLAAQDKALQEIYQELMHHQKKNQAAARAGSAAIRSQKALTCASSMLFLGMTMT